MSCERIHPNYDTLRNIAENTHWLKKIPQSYHETWGAMSKSRGATSQENNCTAVTA